jgi:hypothetical protein
MFAQTIEQIAGRMLFGFAPFASLGGGTRMNLICFVEKVEIGGLESEHHIFRQAALAQSTGLIGGLLHLEKQQDHFVSPPQPQLLRKEGQLTQNMHAAQTMQASVAEIGTPSIMNADPGEVSQDTDLICGLMSSTGMRLIMGQRGSACHMPPDAFSHHVESGFIMMGDLTLSQGSFDALLNWLQEVCRALDQSGQGPLTHVDAQQIREHFCRAASWQQLLGGQIDGHGSNTRSILHGRIDTLGKGSMGVALAMRALFPFPFVLRDMQSRGRWDINHLPAFHRFGRDFAQVCLAVLTVGDRCQDHLLISFWDHLQGLTLMARLPARLSLALLTQASRFSLSAKAVRGWWQRAILAVSGQLLLQPFDFFRQVLDLLTQLAIFFSQLDQFFFRCHALTLLSVMGFGKPLGDLTSYKT